MPQTRLQRRAIGTGYAGALATLLVVACSSFGSSDESPSPAPNEAGAEGAVPEASGPSPDATTTCGTTLTNLATDPLNCGRCGRGCEGGLCTAGQCQPLELATFTDEPVVNVVLTSTRVFWNTMQDVSGGPTNVYSCSKETCGGGPSKLPKSPGTEIVGLGSDGDQRVYGGGLYAGGGLFAIGQATLSTALLPGVAGGPVQMSLRPAEMFYVSFYDPVGFGRTVRRWDYAGTVTKPCVFSANETTSAASFTDARVYLYANGVTTLHSCALVGGSGQFVEYRPNVGVASLTTTSDRVFWADSTGVATSSPDGATSASPRAEIDPAKVGNTKVTSVTVARGELFATTAGGQLWACAPNDCAGTLRKLAEGKNLETFHALFGHTVTADANAVYYIVVDGTPAGTSRTSHLMKVAR